ncbi:hypothetical protein Hanom_Chr14g01274801 [Helianthus anomalus]
MCLSAGLHLSKAGGCGEAIAATSTSMAPEGRHHPTPPELSRGAMGVSPLC